MRQVVRPRSGEGTCMSTLPLSELDLHLTNRCTRRCSYCCYRSGDSLLPELSTNQWMRLLGEAADLGCETIDLTGGEPLLRPDLAALASECARLGISVSVQTNGDLADESTLATLRDAGISRLKLSMDSPDPKTNDRLRGTFASAKTMRAIRTAVRLGIPTHVTAVVSRQTVKTLPALWKRLTEEGIECFRAYYLSPIGRASDRIQEWLKPEEYARIWQDMLVPTLLDSPHGPNRVVIEPGYLSWQDGPAFRLDDQRGCGGGCESARSRRDYLIVRCDGAAFPCIMAVGHDRPLGSILKSSLAGLRGASGDWSFVDRRHLGAAGGDCDACELLSVCGGGCAGYAATLGPASGHRDPRCRPGHWWPVCPALKHDPLRGTWGGSTAGTLSLGEKKR